MYYQEEIPALVLVQQSIVTVTNMSTIPAVPRIGLPNPHVRKPSLSSHLHTEASESSRSEHDEPVPVIPEQHLRHKASSASIQGRVPVKQTSLIGGLPPPPPPLERDASGRYIVPDGQKKNRRLSPPLASHDSGYSSMTPAPNSPVVPFTSMFPTYDPNLSLAKQEYQPTRPLQAKFRDTSTSSIVGLTSIDRALGPRSAPQSVYDVSPGQPSPRISQQPDLERLWQATHGMEPCADVTTYILELSRTEEATFALGSSPTRPFYSMVTYDTNELELSKFNPRKPTVQAEVTLNSIEHPSRRSPPNDGLVTFIFPKMAAMLAITQSTALAAEHNLAPTHRDEIQAAAVRRAADQEACKLFWNVEHQHYELEHPAIGRKEAATDAANFALSPDPRSAQTPAPRRALDILVSCPPDSAMPIITVANSRPSDLESASTPTIPGIRMSTIPQRDTESCLALLDFNTRMLTLNANQILEHVPSLFAIDSVVSAIMAIAVADEVVNPIMSAMEIWQPPHPRSRIHSSTSLPPAAMLRPANSVDATESMAGQSETTNVFYTTIAEREDSEREARKLAIQHEKEVKSERRKHSSTHRKTHKSWFKRSKSADANTRASNNKAARSRKVVTTEFDLEKLSHYQSGSRQGQELPAPARVILSILVGGLKAAVWLITAIVRFFVWVVVHLTRGVTSEKF